VAKFHTNNAPINGGIAATRLVKNFHNYKHKQPTFKLSVLSNEDVVVLLWVIWRKDLLLMQLLYISECKIIEEKRTTKGICGNDINWREK